MRIPRPDIKGKPEYQTFESNLTFYEIFTRLERNYDTVFLLESLGGNTFDSRYSAIGFAPTHILRGEPGKLYVDDAEFVTKNPYYALRDFLPVEGLARNYSGGLVGYLGYDAMNFFEPGASISRHPDFPPFLFGFYEDGLVYDTYTGVITYFYYRRNRMEEILGVLEKENQEPEEPLEVVLEGRSRTRSDHAVMVEKAIEEIRAGNTFQCQIGFQVNYRVRGNLLKIYEELRRINPSPHMFFVKFGDKKLIGASPELLFRLRHGEMESYPLAGTIRRGKDDAEDMELVRKLLSDPKEIAEHNMLIDLHRNDIGRVARFGTVKVRRQFDIKKFSHVQHISSEVVGIIRRDEDMFSGLAHSFPAGTLSGAPKIESMKIIDRIEQSPRGPYGGAVGQFTMNGDCTFAIPIRTLFVSGENAYARASGGIVFDSRTDDEYAEIENKLASVIRALELASTNQARTDSNREGV